jgi:hypothetical protein
MSAPKFASTVGKGSLERNGVLAEIGSSASRKLPAQKAGGLYKTERRGFVEDSPSRAFRDGEGILLVKRSPYVTIIP